MTLQELLLALSNNKDYTTRCTCSDGICHITIEEYWYHREELKQDISLAPGQIDAEILSRFKNFL